MPQSRKIALSSPKKRSSLESASSSPSSINKKDLDQLNTIGTSLTSRKDIESFLSLVVKRSRQIVVGDCSALYLIQKVEDKEEEKLRLHQHNFEHETLELFPKELPLSEQSLA
ncbi:MAG: hypothetical protein KDD52_07310 [Bdellovibrionales bacterium]|nr:hypothetical protein [Bdellovibrionales bacterium]